MKLNMSVLYMHSAPDAPSSIFFTVEDVGPGVPRFTCRVLAKVVEGVTEPAITNGVFSRGGGATFARVTNDQLGNLFLNWNEQFSRVECLEALSIVKGLDPNELKRIKSVSEAYTSALA